jgi:choice-of-anchor B domain-containing protein
MLARLLLVASLALIAAPARAAPTTCTDGVADGHACRRIDLVARLTTSQLGYGNLNDVWGWTDPVGGREYALVGATAGTVFVDITDPAVPRIVGRLPAHENINPTVQLCKSGSGGAGGPQPAHEEGCGGNSSWRNIKVHADHAFIGSEAVGHGLQVFDLMQLRGFPPGSAIQTFDETAHYAGFGNSHTLWIDEASGYLYAVGSNTFNGGPHFVDISDPLDPVAAGGYGGDGYSHEIVCLVYSGPDAAHAGRQICIASNTDTLTVLDVTNKASPQQLARVSYAGVGYTHQGSLTADQRYMFVNDELDELGSGERTRTLVWDLADLDAPVLVQQIHQPRFVIDHNLYLHQGFMYQSDYSAGLVIYDARDPLHAFEVGYFDTHPADDIAQFDGTWSNYPFFASGVVAVSDITRGLYLLRPQLGGAAEDARVTVGGGGTTGTLFTITAPSATYASFSVGAGTQIRSLMIDTAGVVADCIPGLRAIRCKLTALTPTTPIVAQIDAISNDASTPLAVVMVSGSGDESAPADNRVSAFINTTATATPSGGGGATWPGLALLLGLTALVRRRALLLGVAFATAACSAGEPVPAAKPEQIMQFRQVSATLATAGAPAAADMAMLKAAGYTLVVDLRTAEEGLEDERAAAAAAGLTWVNVPVTRQPDRAQLDALSAVLDANPVARTLVHCATNRRASAMVMLDQVTRRGVPLAEAREHVDAVWTPSPPWQAFIDATLAPAPHTETDQETKK